MPTVKAGYHLLYCNQPKDTCRCILPWRYGGHTLKPVYEERVETAEEYRKNIEIEILHWSQLLNDFFETCKKGILLEGLYKLQSISEHLSAPFDDFVSDQGIFTDSYIKSNEPAIYYRRLGKYYHLYDIPQNKDIVPISPFTYTSLKNLFKGIDEIKDLSPINRIYNPFNAILQGKCTPKVFQDCKHFLDYKDLLPSGAIINQENKKPLIEKPLRKLYYIVEKHKPKDVSIITSKGVHGKDGLIKEILGIKALIPGHRKQFDRRCEDYNISGYQDPDTKEFWFYTDEIPKIHVKSAGRGHRLM